MPASLVNQFLTSIADAGRDLLRLRNRRRSIEILCRDLLSTRGEASGTALAREVVEGWLAMDETARLSFFRMLQRDFGADPQAVEEAIEAYRTDPGARQLRRLHEATEPARLELFRRMNMAPQGTFHLIQLRAELLRHIPAHPELAEVDADLQRLLSGWFNPGFLTLARIDWNSPASLLEKIVEYEKVHRIPALEALRRRLAADRRCFAFFHPALPQEPLIFVEVALVRGMSDKVQPLLDEQAPIRSPREADTAIFYSINNCLEGLRGVTLGNFLIKLVVADLQRELGHLRTFATLSPVPGFARWLEQAASAGEPVIGEREREALQLLEDASWHQDPQKRESLRPVLLRLCAHYLVRVKRNGRPLDPVARFHLHNGARLERINWMADVSEKGLRESFGIMVNYLYDPARIERHHEAYVASGTVTHSAAVRNLLPPTEG